MKISQAAKIWIDYHVINSKKNTVRAYRWIINQLCIDFGGMRVGEVLKLRFCDIQDRKLIIMIESFQFRMKLPG